MAARAHRCEANRSRSDVRSSNYASAFEATIATGSARSPDEWARAIFDGGPRAVRTFVVFGWRFVLGLRLGPSASPDYVAGWTIRDCGPTILTLEARSWLLDAEKEIQVANGMVCVSTFVNYRRRLGRAVWALVAPVHHRTEPYLIAHAVSTGD